MIKTLVSCLLVVGTTSLAGVIAPAQAFTPLSLTKTFNNPTAEDDDYFGSSVSLSGTSALIGAPYDNTGAPGAGSAYLFDTTTGTLKQTFNNPTPASADNFGYSVSLSGTTALIGAPYDSTGATSAGSAYLFDTTTGNLLKTFNNPTAEDDDYFGYSVSLSGTTALIGAYRDDTGATNAGSAYLFETTTGTLKQTFNNPTPADGDNFGNSVSFSGTSALIGAPNDSTGAPTAGSAYLYQETQTVQVPEPSLTILGTGVVLGVLPFLKKGKKDKEKDV